MIHHHRYHRHHRNHPGKITQNSLADAAVELELAALVIAGASGARLLTWRTAGRTAVLLAELALPVPWAEAQGAAPPLAAPSLSSYRAVPWTGSPTASSPHQHQGLLALWTSSPPMMVVVLAPSIAADLPASSGDCQSA